MNTEIGAKFERLQACYPQFDFGQLTSWDFDPETETWKKKGVHIDPSMLGRGCVIFDGVEIDYGAYSGQIVGDRCVFGPNVKIFGYAIEDGVVIGENCRIIGDPAYDNEIHSGVKIGHEAVISSEIINEGAIIGSRVLLANRTRVGAQSQIEESAEVWEGVNIGERTTIEESSVVEAGVPIGNDCRLGCGFHLPKGTILCDGQTLGVSRGTNNRAGLELNRFAFDSSDYFARSLEGMGQKASLSKGLDPF